MSTQGQIASPQPVSLLLQPLCHHLANTVHAHGPTVPGGHSTPQFTEPLISSHSYNARGAWEIITPFVQRRTLRRSSAQELGLLWTPSSLKPGLTFPGPLSTGLGAVHAQPVLSLLCPSPLPSFHPSPLSHFSVSQQEGLQEIHEKTPSTVPGTQQALMQGGCLPGPSPGLLLRKWIT